MENKKLTMNITNVITYCIVTALLIIFIIKKTEGGPLISLTMGDVNLNIGSRNEISNISNKDP